MRVLALLTDAYGGHGGIARYNRDLLAALAGSDFIDEIIALTRGGAPDSETLPPKTVQLPPLRSPASYSARATRLALASGPFDILFCGHLNMGPLAAGLARIARAPLWLQLHGIEAWERPRSHRRLAAERADVVTAVSRYTRRRFLDWADVDPARVRVLPNTVEPRFAPGPKPRRIVERHGLDGRKVLLTVSRLAATERYKGHDRVIAALPAVLQRHADALYVIAGEGDDRARLMRLAEDTGVADAVRFIGQVPADELPDTYRAADLFVMPSTGEGFGIVLLEAASTGLPVIGGNRDGSVDALADGALGTLVDADNAAALAAAIVESLDRPRAPDAAHVARFAYANFARHVEAIVGSLSAKARSGGGRRASSPHPPRIGMGA